LRRGPTARAVGSSADDHRTGVRTETTAGVGSVRRCRLRRRAEAFSQLTRRPALAQRLNRLTPELVRIRRSGPRQVGHHPFRGRTPKALNVSTRRGPLHGSAMAALPLWTKAVVRLPTWSERTGRTRPHPE
jgi:hypothetical protein